MSLKIELKITPTTLLMQQDTTVEYKLTNRGAAPIRVLNPLNSLSMPVWRVLSLDTGVEQVFRKKLDMYSEDLPPMDLAPGQSVPGGMNLLDLISFPVPGTYEIVEEYEYNEGGGIAKSDPVRVVIQPSNPRNFKLYPLYGGRETNFNVLWANPSTTGAQLMMTRLELVDQPRIGGTVSLDKTDFTLAPCMMVPANGKAAERRWVAWLDKGSLNGFRLTGDAKDGKVIGLVPLPDVPTTLIAPLLPWVESGGDEGGAAVLYQAAGDGRSIVRMALIGPNGAVQPGPSLPIQGGAAAWAETITLSTGERRVYVITRSAPEGKVQLSLQCVSWAPKAAELKQTGQAVIEGQWLASAMVIDRDDTVRGAVLSATQPEMGETSISLRQWTHTPAGKIEVSEPIAITVPWGAPIDEARLAIGDNGKTFGICKYGDKPWSAFSSEAPVPKPVQPPAGATSGQIEIIMLTTRVPALMFTAPQTGFQFSAFDGGPIPEQPHT